MSIKTKCYIRGLEHGSLSRDSQRATLILTAGFLRRPAGAEAGDGNWPWQRQAGGGRKRSNVRCALPVSVLDYEQDLIQRVHAGYRGRLSW